MSITFTKKSKMELKFYLLKHNIKRETFAKKLGMSREMLYKVMSGKVKTTLTVAHKIEEITNGEVTLYDIPYLKDSDVK